MRLKIHFRKLLYILFNAIWQTILKDSQFPQIKQEMSSLMHKQERTHKQTHEQTQSLFNIFKIWHHKKMAF